jgi:cytochrome P450
VGDVEIDLERFDPFDANIQQCPHPHYAAMRASQPVFRVPGTNLFLVTRHDLVTPILRDPVTFSNRFGGPSGPVDGELGRRLAEVSAEGWPQVSTLLTEDPPRHTAYRSTINAAFSPKRIRELEPAIRAICDDLIDRCLAARRVEVVRDLAVPLPVRVIARVLDVPDDRLADFKRWSDDSTVAIGALVDDDTRVAAQRGIVELQHYFAAQLEDRRARPRDDVLSVLVAARIADPDDGGRERPLDVPEMLSIIQQLLVAGNETTTKLLTEGVRLLAEHPDEWARLRADPGRAAAVAEEVTRLAAPTQGMFRVVTRDTTIDGDDVPAGSMLVVMYAAANRDPAVFPAPDAFDPDRANQKEHLAFGRGVHFCVGAPLARLESTIAFERLAARVAEIRLDPTNTFEYEPSFVLRGLVRLDVELLPA